MISARERTGLSDRLTSPQPGGRFLQRGLFIQSEYTLFLPSNCPTNQDHLTSMPEADNGVRTSRVTGSSETRLDGATDTGVAVP